jgi:hypothetical protein
MADAGEASRLARFVAPIGIAILVIIVLLAAIHTSIIESAHTSSYESAYWRSNGQVSSWTDSNEQFQCLRAAFQKEVPRGSGVLMGNPASNSWARMVAEIAAPWAVPASRSLARWAVIIAYGNECAGLTLLVFQLR